MKLSDAQKCAMQSLQRSGGYCRLSNGMFQTFCILADRGLVTVTIDTPVNGYVAMTEEGKKLYPLPIYD